MGLRPGEKLHESLVCGVETVEDTAHPQIMAVVGEIPGQEQKEGAIAQLQTVIQNVTEIEELWAIAQQCKSLLEFSSDRQKRQEDHSE
jgi:FlaA1/EpsC-like NDP-sugar epimerase